MLPLARVRTSGLKATLSTASAWPVNRDSTSRVQTSYCQMPKSPPTGRGSTRDPHAPSAAGKARSRNGHTARMRVGIFTPHVGQLPPRQIGSLPCTRESRYSNAPLGMGSDGWRPTRLGPDACWTPCTIFRMIRPQRPVTVRACGSCPPDPRVQRASQSCRYWQDPVQYMRNSWQEGWCGRVRVRLPRHVSNRR